MNLLDITTAQLEEAYRKNNLTPRTCFHVPGKDRRCCALGAILYDRITAGRYGIFAILAEQGYIQTDAEVIHWTWGFDRGLRGRPILEGKDKNLHKFYEHAYHLGIYCRLAFAKTAGP